MCYTFVTYLNIEDAAPCVPHVFAADRSIDMASKKETIPLTYKGHPLRRKDNLIYYGDMADSHIILLQILETKPVNDMEVATKVSIQLQLTAPDLKSRDRVIKRSEKNSLYSAIDVASVWLERALAAR